MKNFTTSLLIIFMLSYFGFTSKSVAQVDVTINPIGLLWGNISLGADFALSENFSIEGQVGYSSGDEGNSKYSGIPITAYGKYYFNPNRGTDKFYLSAFTRFVSRSYKDDDGSTSNFEYTQTRLGLGVGLGYKVVSAGNFVFDIGFGVGRAIIDNTNFKSGDDEILVDWPDIMFAGKLAVGYRF
nr:DUF3575 domain-containing protein [Saprospiraceae bacterium]